MQSQGADLRSELGHVQANLFNAIPFDRRDVELDIRDLTNERSSVLAIRPGSSSTPTDGGGASDEIARLSKQLRTVLTASNIQKSQLQLIGSFQSGALHVPVAGLAQLHAGERVIPRGARPDFERGGRSGDPTVIQITVEDGIIRDAIRAEVISGADDVDVRLGQSADHARREGRF